MTDNITTIMEAARARKRGTIAPGSTVELKTGGPSLVVEVRTAEKAYCVWHNAERDLLRDWVPIICLKVK